jgi:hypothetical protein
MIKLGDTIDVTKYHGIAKMWLVSDLGLKKYTPEHYVVMGFIPNNGWCTLNNGSLKNMRAWMEQYR